MENKTNQKDLKKMMDDFLQENPVKTPVQATTQSDDMDCSSGVCIIKGDKSVLERINKKIITEDGRQLLI